MSPPCRSKGIRLYIFAYDVTIRSMISREGENGIERGIYYPS